MRQSILEAIKQGHWNYDPDREVARAPDHSPTQALPGSAEKLAVLSERIHCGLPLWHPLDRRSYDDGDRS